MRINTRHTRVETYGKQPRVEIKIRWTKRYQILSSPMSFDGFCRDMVDSLENNWVSCEIVFLPPFFFNEMKKENENSPLHPHF